MRARHISRLPLRKSHTWLGSRRPSAVQIEGEGEMDLILWCESRSGKVRSFALVPSGTRPGALWESLVAAMAEPLPGLKPCRPARVAVDDPELVEQLAPHLEPIGTEIRLRPTLPALDRVYETLENMLEQGPGLSYLADTGVTPEQVEALLAESYTYFDLAPWNDVTDSELLRVTGLRSVPVICSVMGNAGIETGLAIFLGEETARHYLEGDLPPNGAADALSLSLLPPEEIPPALQLEILECGWAVHPDGFPLLIATDGESARAASAREMDLAIRVIEAVRIFLEEGEDEASQFKLWSGERVTVAWAPDIAEETSWLDEFRPADIVASLEQSLRRAPQDTRLALAQDLAYRAALEPNDRKRVRLARQALEHSADCADAYLVLAESAAESPEEALSYQDQAIEAGLKGLPGELIEENAGSLWEFLETRPYLRALRDRMETLWSLGREIEAVDTGRRLLDLDEGDHQGIRFMLAYYLAAREDDDHLEELIREFPWDRSAEWQFTGALSRYRIDGDSREARKRLRNALKANDAVPDFLLGRRRIPRELPDVFTPGGREEAQVYAFTWRELWKSTRGALTWLREQAS